jgi:hypothetical protein
MVVGIYEHSRVAQGSKGGPEVGIIRVGDSHDGGVDERHRIGTTSQARCSQACQQPSEVGLERYGHILSGYLRIGYEWCI